MLKVHFVFLFAFSNVTAAYCMQICMSNFSAVLVMVMVVINLKGAPDLEMGFLEGKLRREA